MQVQKLAPEVFGSVEQIGTDAEDVREDEVLGRTVPTGPFAVMDGVKKTCSRQPRRRAVAARADGVFRAAWTLARDAVDIDRFSVTPCARRMRRQKRKGMADGLSSSFDHRIEGVAPILLRVVHHQINEDRH